MGCNEQLYSANLIPACDFSDTHRDEYFDVVQAPEFDSYSQQEMNSYHYMCQKPLVNAQKPGIYLSQTSVRLKDVTIARAVSS